MSSRNFSLRTMAVHRYGEGFPEYVESLTNDSEERAFLYHFALYCFVHHPSWLIAEYNRKSSLRYGKK